MAEQGASATFTVVVDGQTYEITPKPVDYVLAESRYGSLSSAPEYTLACFMAWNAGKRQQLWADPFDAWLARVDDLEAVEDAPLEGSGETS